MLKRLEDNRKQIEFLSLEDLVPCDHLVRKMENAIDFNFIYEDVKDLYSDLGRASIDPVSLIKIVLVQYMFGIRSMRQTIKELEVNLAYRWFCGFGISSKIPHFSTFGKNYMRRFKDNDIFQNIFNKILTEAIDNKFVDTKAVYMDSTHIKASANKHKKIEVYVKKETKNYQKTLEEEINLDREDKGKKHFDSKDDDDNHKITQSTTDPDCGEFNKGEHEKQFAYSAHTVCDNKGFVLDYELTPANKHDSTQFSSLYQKVLKKHNFEIIALDAGYKTPAIAKEILESGKTPLMPYTRKKKKQTIKFEYDKYYDFYTCPAGNILEHSTTNRLGYREYKSDSKMCKLCPNFETCLSKTAINRKVFRHIWQENLDIVNELRFTNLWKEYYPQRKQTIERIFGEAKERHGMRYTQLRGKEKVGLQILLTFSCLNLKKLANWKWKREGKSSKKSFLFPIIEFFEKIFKNRKLFA